ncbi:MAG: hypothetical protein BWK79_16175 [Beggiatoa sp. IS2]|nr:MAG: hypothetical protein BWK79_16175 [Beggiatoa sp. IS2]
MNQLSPKIFLLGTSFETSNLGLNALTESTLKCIFMQWPQAEVTLRANVDESDFKLTILDHEVIIKRKRLWFSRNPLQACNVYLLLTYAILQKIFPFKWLKKRLKARNSYFNAIMETNCVMDITGGDSFTDLYGMHRFIQLSLVKWLFILCQRKLILLPQTYGPFNHAFSRWAAHYLLKRTTVIYSRDYAGVEYVKTALSHTTQPNQMVRFIPDMAFVLDTEKPKGSLMSVVKTIKVNHILIGLNISGLLYHKREFKADQQLALQNNYPALIDAIIKLFMEYSNTTVILVPHVYAKPGHFESDPDACQEVYEKMIHQYRGRLLHLEDHLDHKQVKFLIGHCDFFLGSRMHSCIAAISQAVPTVGIAYSAKFFGVFESAGIENCVVDLRSNHEQKILAEIRQAFEQRHETAEKLREIIPKVQQQVLTLCPEIDSKVMQTL